MQRRFLLRRRIALLTGLALYFWLAPTLHAAGRPNVVILLADDLGYAELGCQGNDEIPTPHIDSVAARGIRFTSAYVTASYCSPSRAGLMTGKFQSRFGYEFNPVGALNADPLVGLPGNETTLAEYLQRHGYATALIGKWHLGGTAAYHPLRRGFDEFFGFLHEGHYYVPPPYERVTTMLRRRALPDGGSGRWISPDRQLILSTHMGTHEPAYDADNPLLRNGQPVSEEAYLTDAFAREACAFIGRNRKRPFFLYLAFNAVHSPLQGADAYMQRFSHVTDVHRRIFAAMLSNLDDAVGEVLSALQQYGLTENTLVVFLSDNGGPTKELTSSNLPLRGGKGDMYEGGLRVPFLIQWPGRLGAGTVDDTPICSIDLVPTALAAAGIPLPADVDGVNLLLHLQGEAAGRPHQTLFWRQGKRRAMRHGNWKLVYNPPETKGRRWELYDLESDLSEEHDLADNRPETLAELEKIWSSWTAQLPDPIRPRGR